MRTKTSALGIRWAARASSLLSILIILVFAIGESAGSHGPWPSPQEWVGLALWPIGVAVGLAVAWFREKLGGIAALAFLVAFYVWNLFRLGHLPRGPFFLLISAPAFLFLAAGFIACPKTAQGA